MVKIKERYECPLLKKKCLEMLCAWWVAEEEMCSVISMARVLNTQKQLI